MKNSKKKSPAKSKKTIKKNPLRKYQTAGVGPPALGSSSFAPSTGIQIGGSPTNTFGSGSQYSLANPYNPVTNPTVGSQGGFQVNNATANSFMNGTATSLPDSGSLKVGSAYGGNDLSLDRTATPTPGESGMFDTKVEGLNEMKSLDLAAKPKPQQMTKGEITTAALGAVPGTVGAIASLAKGSDIKDPSGYYDKKTKAELERYNKKINASSAASAVGSGILATSAAWGPLAFIPAAVGGITMAASEGAKASYQAKQGNLGTSYDERVADRMKYKESQAQRRQENLDRNAATNYYSQGSGLAKYGGMREYQMGGEYQKVTGPSHENGGIDMDLSGDGVNDAELEGGEIIEEMKHGGNAPKKYIWSDHLKTGGMSFAKKFEKLRKGGARPGDVETLRIEQEIAAKRDPSKLYAKYGGIMKYQQGGTNTQYVGLDSAEVSNLQKYKASGMSTQDAMRRATLGEDDLTRRLSGLSSPQPIQAEKLMIDRADMRNERLSKDLNASQRETQLNRASFESNRRTPIVLPMKSAIDPDFKNGGLMKYQEGGSRVSRTDTGKFLAEYGAPMASLAGGIGDIAMNLRQEYNPVETVNARELTADKIYIDRAKDKQAGFRESELMGAKRASRATTGTGATQRENALRMTSLRAGEEAAQNIYEQNRQASTDEQKINLDAQMRVDEANRQTDLAKSESRRNEGLRKESFENMRKKYIGSVAGQLGNELASGMYRKEYINATLPDGVNPYALKPRAISDQMKKINPATGKQYTYADAINEVLIQYNLENP